MTALAQLVAALHETERMPRHAFRQRQAVLLDAMLAHHARTTRAFAERLSAARLPVSDARAFDLLQKIPPISRRGMQGMGPEGLSTAIPQRHLPLDRVKTSGSTGEPVAIARTAINQLYWLALGMRDHVWNRRDVTGRLCAIRAGISEVLHLPDWGAPANLLHRTGPCLGIPITTPIHRQLELLEEFQPDVLLVYPNNLRALADAWLTRGHHPASLKHVRTVGETVSDDLRRHVMSACGIRIEDSYSSQEAGPIAIQCPEGGQYHVMGEALHVDVLHPDDTPCRPGETGRVVITDLHNLATPLVRYDIGDYATVAGDCPCGRTLPSLQRIVGRERNLLRRPDGSRHWPLVGFHLFDGVAPVRQYQFIQHEPARIEFRVVTDEPLHEDQEQGLLAIATSALGQEFEIVLAQSRTRLPSGPGGKFEEFVCRL